MEHSIDTARQQMFSDIRLVIEQTRQQVATAVNAGMTLMYWHIGERINREVLGGERAAYGKQIVAELARKLTQEYGGKQYSEKNLNRMRLFAERIPNLSIWTSVMSKLSWTHFLQVISIEDELKREFYLTMAAEQRWSVRMLKSKIDGMLYERTAIAKQPDIDLKLGNFKAAYKGQMELYLRWLEKYEKFEWENKPIGLILCAGKNEEHVELMHLHESNIRVAEYLTKLPDRKLLEQKLQQAVAIARQRLMDDSRQ